jgi:hypothetical protein
MVDYCGHVDLVEVDHSSGQKGLQVFFGIEMLTHAGTYLVTLTGKIHRR